MSNRSRKRTAGRAKPTGAGGEDGFRPDSVPGRRAEPKALANPVWLHPSVSDTLRGWPHLYRRLGLILEQLAAHGRTAIVKGCARPNRGWRRSPLGGANGNQYYLWWGIAGSSGPADSCGAGAGDDRRARRAAPRRPQAALGGARAGLPADRAGDRDRRRHRRTAAQQPAGGVRDRPEPGAGAPGTPRQRQDDGAVAGHRGPLGRERALRHLVGAAETQRRGAAQSIRAGGEPDPGNRLPDAHRRGHRRGRAADATRREPRETRGGHSERGRAREASVEGPRRGGVRRGPRTPARPGRRRGGRQRGRREAGGAAPGGLPPPAGPRAGHRRRDGEDAPAGCGRRSQRPPASGYSPNSRPRPPRRACWPRTARRRGWSSTASSSTRRRT